MVINEEILNDKKYEDILKMPVYVCLWKVDDKYYIMCDKKDGIIGFSTKQNAIKSWDVPYENAFKRGLGAITGATLLHVRTMPRIVFFKSQKTMIEKLFIKYPFKKITILFNNAIECQRDVKKIYDEGYEIELFKKI